MNNLRHIHQEDGRTIASATGEQPRQVVLISDDLTVDEKAPDSALARWGSAVASSVLLHVLIVGLMSLIVIVATREAEPNIITILPMNPETDLPPMEILPDLVTPELLEVSQPIIVDVPPQAIGPSDVLTPAVEVANGSLPAQAVAGGNDDVAAVDRMVGRAGGSTQKILRFSLSWNTTDDLDLGIETPSGNYVWYQNRTADGGTLDVDANVGGETRTPVENIVWAAAPEKNGVYTVNVQFYARHSFGSKPVDFTLVTYVNGKADVQKRQLRNPGHTLTVGRVRYTKP